MREKKQRREKRRDEKSGNEKREEKRREERKKEREERRKRREKKEERRDGSGALYFVYWERKMFWISGSPFLSKESYKPCKHTLLLSACLHIITTDFWKTNEVYFNRSDAVKYLCDN